VLHAEELVSAPLISQQLETFGRAPRAGDWVTVVVRGTVAQLVIAGAAALVHAVGGAPVGTRHAAGL
jgi:hypothetical protein